MMPCPQWLRRSKREKFLFKLQNTRWDLMSLKDFHSHCQRNGQMRDKIIGIYGMGGSGKTTLAKYLFNHKHSEFSGSTIQFDVRENDVKNKLTSLQSKLLTDLFPRNHYSFCSIEEGTARIKDDLEKNPESKFLLILDNIDHQKQLDALLPMDALNTNSLVIVTTRDVKILIKAGVRVRYKMKVMNPEHSKELFCWHAFHKRSCKTEFNNLVNSFVKTCGGLPLALQVMGGHVFGSDKAYWKLQLDFVKGRMHRDVKDTLKISYDALEEDEKQIFMDVACFFIGEDVSRAMSIWKTSGWRAEHALQTLKDKCLVEVQTCFDEMFSDEKCHYEPEFIFRMHDHLRDLGREMADNEMSHPRRLWRPENLIGMSELKGFQDTLSGSEGKGFRCSSVLYDLENDCSECVLESGRLNDLESGRLNDLENDRQSDLESEPEKDLQMTYFLGSSNSKASTDLQWLELHYHGYYSFIPQCIPLHNLHTIRLRGVSPARLCQMDDQVLLKLKELSCSFENVNLLNSYRDMFVSDLNKLMSSLGMFKHLENLNLRFVYGIRFLDGNCLLKFLRELANLQTLELTSFQLEGEIAFRNRGEATDDRFRMTSLEAITLCRVFETVKVSIHGQFCPALKSLKLYFMAELIVVDLTGLTTLESLELLNCRDLRKVLGNDLLKLEMFRIKLCQTRRKLPNFPHVSCLKKIYISRCQSLQDISAIERMKGLKRIWIAHCPELKSIKGIKELKGLRRIWIEECRKLEGVISFKESKDLKRIFIGQCNRLHDIEGIEFLIHLESIIIVECPKLQTIRGIEELKGLKEMIITNSPIISCVERLQRLLSEVTILVWRLAMPGLIADRIGDTLSMADAFCEIDCEEKSQTQIIETIHSFHKTQHSLSTFIICAKLKTCIGTNPFQILNGPVSTCIVTDICNGFLWKKDFKNGIKWAGGEWIYTCVVTAERFSKYESWMPSHRYVEKAFLMGVKKGEESKTICILQSLFAQLSVDNSEFPEGRVSKPFKYEEDEDSCIDEEDEGSCIDYDEFAYYVDDDDEYDDDDDDEYDDDDDEEEEVNSN